MSFYAKESLQRHLRKWITFNLILKRDGAWNKFEFYPFLSLYWISPKCQDVRYLIRVAVFSPWYFYYNNLKVISGIHLHHHYWSVPCGFESRLATLWSFWFSATLKGVETSKGRSTWCTEREEHLVGVQKEVTLPVTQTKPGCYTEASLSCLTAGYITTRAIPWTAVSLRCTGVVKTLFLLLTTYLPTSKMFIISAQHDDVADLAATYNASIPCGCWFKSPGCSISD